MFTAKQVIEEFGTQVRLQRYLASEGMVVSRAAISVWIRKNRIPGKYLELICAFLVKRNIKVRPADIRPDIYSKKNKRGKKDD